MIKTCNKCGQQKPLDEFYQHYGMTDGHLNQCKVCVRGRVKRHRDDNLAEHQERDRARSHDECRRIMATAYQRGYRLRNWKKAAARNAVSNAIAEGSLSRQPCEVCGEPDSEAHHDDYDKQLDVRWLCFKHHREHHGQRIDD